MVVQNTVAAELDLGRATDPIRLQSSGHTALLFALMLLGRQITISIGRHALAPRQPSERAVDVDVGAVQELHGTTSRCTPVEALSA
jgi:hypothetical protein